MKNDFETNTYVNIIFLSVFDLLECQPGKTATGNLGSYKIMTQRKWFQTARYTILFYGN